MHKIFIYSCGVSILTNQQRYFSQKIFQPGGIPSALVPLSHNDKEKQNIIRTARNTLLNLKTEDERKLKSSAEINSILSREGSTNFDDTIYLLCTDTPEGSLAGECNAQVLHGLGFSQVEIKTVDKLSLYHDESERLQALNRFITIISDIKQKADRETEIVVDVSGSYKAVSGWLMFAGLLLNLSVQYTFEAGKHMMLPSFPLVFNPEVLRKINPLHLYRFHIAGATTPEIWEGMKSAVPSFDISSLIDQTEGEPRLSSLGKIFIGNYIQMMTDERSKVFKRDALDIIAEWEVRTVPVKPAMPLAIAFFDLDNFKAINTEYGHHMGDNAILTLGEFLKTQMRELRDSFFARNGGDEFVGLIPCRDMPHAREILETIVKGIAGLSVEDMGYVLKASCGAAFVNDSQPKLTIKQCLRKADILKCKAKRAGKNRVEIKNVTQIKEEEMCAAECTTG